MTTSAHRVDRRALRTRHLLRQASIEVVREKGFRATRVRDIAERANVNRSTFYAHFTDKYALTDAFARDEFRSSVTSQLPAVARWDATTVQRLVQLLLERAGNGRHRCRDSDLLRPLIQRAAQEELSALLLSWLRQGEAVDRWRVPPATVADLASWTILGAVCQWHASAETTPTAEQLAAQVRYLIMEGVLGVSAGSATVSSFCRLSNGAG
jgi:AcrR family transcriptional regulator